MTDLAEFHDDLRAVARELLAPTSPLVTGGQPVGADWRRLAAAGWLGLEVPDEHGGAGASFAEVAVVLEELGRAATASPVLGAVLAVGALLLVEPAPARDDLLAGIAAGDVRVAVALPTRAVGVAGPLPFRVDRADGRARLVGRAPFVPDAPGAGRVLVVADDPPSGPVLVEVAPGAGVEVRDTPVVDATRSLGEVVADGDHLIEPARLWQERVPAKWRDTAPRGEGDSEFWVYEDRQIVTTGLNAVAGKSREEFSPEPITYQDMRLGCYEPAARVADMDQGNVLASMLFPRSPGTAASCSTRRSTRTWPSPACRPGTTSSSRSWRAPSPAGSSR